LNCFVFITASNLQSYNWSYFPTGLEADCRGQWRTTGAFRQPLTPVMTFTTVAPPLAPSPSPLTGCGDFPYARSRISLIAAILTCSLCACLAKRTNSAKASGAYRSATALISTVVLFSEPFGRPPSFPFSRQISALDIFQLTFRAMVYLGFLIIRIGINQLFSPASARFRHGGQSDLIGHAQRRDPPAIGVVLVSGPVRGIVTFGSVYVPSVSNLSVMIEFVLSALATDTGRRFAPLSDVSACETDLAG